MPNRFRSRVPDLAAYLRGHEPKAPPLTMNTLIPVLRGNNYQDVNRLLGGARRLMNQMGVDQNEPGHDPGLMWQALGPNRNAWTPQLRQVFDNRSRALQIVAHQLENQVPGFQGLARQLKYNPSHHALDRATGGVVVDWNQQIGGAHQNPVAHIGDPAFRSPQDLVRVAMHEGRHLYQSRRGGEFNRPNVLAEADAYLFDLEHHNLSGINAQRMRDAAHQFRTLLDVNDRLATGRRVDPFYTRDPSQGGMGIRETMSGVKRADLELRWSFIEPGIRRQSNAFAANRYGQDRAIGFQPSGWGSGYNPSNPLRSFWR
jgi:hypothetical protein